MLGSRTGPTQRRTGEANRPNYSGKHRRHGLRALALTDERGRLVMVVTGFKATRARKLAPAEREANRILAAGRAPVERGFALVLTNIDEATTGK